jgi:UDP-N-acetylglucosamine 2-epimerase
MKQRLLIVSEDIAQIQILSGKLGRTYSLIYQNLLKIKLRVTIFLLKSKYQVTLLASDSSKLKHSTSIQYSQAIDPHRLTKYKSLAWNLTNKITKTIIKADKTFTLHQSIPLIKLWENNLSLIIMYRYLSYLELIDRTLESKKYDVVLILGQSFQEKLAKFYSKTYKLKLLNFSWPNLNFVNQWLFYYFRYRELTKKINHFKNQSLKSKAKLKLSTSPILLSVDFYRHLKTLVPVYNQLKKLNLNPWLTTDDSSIKSRLDRFKLHQPNYLFLASFLPQNYLNINLSAWKNSVNHIHQKTKSLLTSNSSSLDDFLLKEIFNEISPLIKHGLIVSKLYLAAGEQLFKTLKPKCVVVVADTRLVELTLSHLAKKYHTPSLTVSSKTMIFDEETYQFNATDLFSVTGNQARDQLIKVKVPKGKIHVLGDPRYDYFKLLEKNFSPSQVYQKLGLKNSTKKIILLISFRSKSEIPKEEKKDFFIFSSQAVKQLGSTILVVKPHPTEKRSNLLQELKEWGITNAIVADNNQLELFDLLKVSSVVVLTWSMTGLEAMMLNKPVISLNPHSKDYDKYIPYIKNSAVAEANSAEELIKHLKILTNQDHLQTKALLKRGTQFTKKYIRPYDGQASQRIVNLIKQII